MFKLIKNARVYAPKDLGIKDVLICNDKIIDIDTDIQFTHKTLDIIDAGGKIITPGIIDQHVHVTGGGGEGSFKSRVPEVMLSELVESGTTTVVGLLGTDAVTRSVENLLAKTKALNEEGITAYCLTGSYDYPGPTVTGDVKKDLTFIKEILGVKLAISDHRAPLVTKDELKKLVSDIRVSGMFCGKSTYIKLHMGDGAERLSVINQILDETDLPITHFRPTHVGREIGLFNESMDFAKKGGIIDFTASDYGNMMPLSELVNQMKKNEVPLKNVTISSDGRGSWSTYDEMGRLERMGHAACDTMYVAIKDLTNNGILPFEEALALGTVNVAEALNLKGRGVIEKNGFADLLILEENLDLNSVLMNGRMMMQDKKTIVKGTYE